MGVWTIADLRLSIFDFPIVNLKSTIINPIILSIEEGAFKRPFLPLLLSRSCLFQSSQSPFGDDVEAGAFKLIKQRQRSNPTN